MVFTGRILAPSAAYRAYVQELLNRPVSHHELASEELAEQLKELACPEAVRILDAMAALAPEDWEMREFTSEQRREADAAGIAALPDNAIVVAMHPTGPTE